jgi:hypothetical protein
MKRLTLSEFRKVLAQYLAGDRSFDELRHYVYQYYEGEKPVTVDAGLEEMLPVFAPYLEYEEAHGDPQREARMMNMGRALTGQSALRERAVFGLEFGRIMDLTEKLESGAIDSNVYEGQLRTLTPVDFDWTQVSAWARAHISRQAIAPELLI